MEESQEHSEQRSPCLNDARLCEFIETVEKLDAEVSLELDELYASLQRVKVYDALDRKATAVYDTEYARYRECQILIIDLRTAALALFELLQRILEGEQVTESELMMILSTHQIKMFTEESEQTPDSSTSKMRKKIGTGTLMSAGLETDPRRISTGRNATRVTFPRGINPMLAEQEFMDATSGTHGGKVRYVGKKTAYYIGKSGRRIRKA